jgi:hypothetical protein
MNSRAQNVIGFIIVLAGTLMVISGLCILALSALRR